MTRGGQPQALKRSLFFICRFVQNPRCERAADGHCALRTEFLAAKAADADPSVDDRPGIAQRDGVRRAGVCTDAAANAFP